jgi:TonB family protein
MPSLGELGDSAQLALVLSRGADPQAPVTFAALRFDKKGLLRQANGVNVRSPEARSKMEDTLRTVIRAIGASPRDFEVNLAWVNTTRQLRLLAKTATCEPQRHITPQGEALLRRNRGRMIRRTAVVEFILEADGHVAEAWIAVSAGSPGADSLAMQLFRETRFSPAIVGRRPVAALVGQPFEF